MAVLIHSSSHTQFLQSDTPPLGVRFGVLSLRTWTDFCKCLNLQRASLVAQRLKRLPPMWETWVQSLGWEDPLEKEMVTHSSILLWRIPWMEEPGGLQSMGSQRVGDDWATSLSLSFSTYRIQWNWQWLPRLEQRRHYNFHLPLGSLTVGKRAAMHQGYWRHLVERNWSPKPTASTKLPGMWMSHPGSKHFSSSQDFRWL